MKELHIRSGKQEDAERLVTVYRNAYRENRELGYPTKAASATEADIHDWLEAARVFVAEIDGRVVGAIRIEETNPERAKISRLGVHEDWKRNGIGSALLNHAEELARAEGFDAVWLTTPEDHPHLLSFYRDQGYRETGDYPLEYRAYDEVVMVKSPDVRYRIPIDAPTPRGMGPIDRNGYCQFNMLGRKQLNP